MAFRGLFVGIDRYADPRVPWLGAAARDARALHALFADSLGDTARLLVDEEATRAAIEAALSDLADTAQADDVVVVAFSGHGTEDHHLVSFDADADQVDKTCLSLEELGTAISAIPGSTLLCVLDCCFSGGLGARVLTPDLRARAISSITLTDSLDRFVAEGRVVLTASSEHEEAHESAATGHGLLTWRLLEALRGASEVREGDRLSLYRVVEFVTRMVQADAQRMGRTQTPSLRGKVEGAPTWPVLVPGARFAVLFPDALRTPATPDVQTLVTFGLTQPIVDAWRSVVPELNALQLSAVNDYGLLDGENLVVTAPTSSGKTMIGELAALRSASEHRRAIFLLPMRALVNDKFEYFDGVYSTAGIKTIRATGEYSDDVADFLRGRFDIALLTYEKYSALALGNPHVLEFAATVVVDEAQTLADSTRGANLEFVLTLLRRARARMGAPQLLTLSAVVGDLCGLERWLGGRNLHSELRPVPLVEGVVLSDGSYQYLDAQGEEHVEGWVEPLHEAGSRRVLIPLLRRLTAEGKKVLVFRQTKGESIACAVYLSQALGLEPADSVIESLPTRDASTSALTLRRTLAGGVAFHNSDLDKEERRLVEEAFRDAESQVRVISSTPTLAMGINTPATAVAIVGLTHPGRPPTAYSVAEYKNMVGRAGRLGFSETGESYLVPEGALDPNRAWAGYVKGRLESLVSHLVPDGDPRSLMLRVLAAQPPDALGVVTEADVLGFLESSLAAFQAREATNRAQWDSDRLQRGFEQLVASKLIEPEGLGYRLTELGRFTGESGTHVDSIRRLVHALSQIEGPLNSVGLVAAAQLTNELDDVYLPVNARARNTEVPRWPRVLGQQGVPGALIQELQYTAQDQAQATSRAKRTAAAAFWIAGVAIEQIELEITQHLRQRGGVAGAVRAVADRTRDLLPAVAAVLHELSPANDIQSLVSRTMLRLELGIPADLVDLVRASRIELGRGDWLALLAAGVSTFEDLKELSHEDLVATLGSASNATQVKRAILEAEQNAAVDAEPLSIPTPTE